MSPTLATLPLGTVSLSSQALPQRTLALLHLGNQYKVACILNTVASLASGSALPATCSWGLDPLLLPPLASCTLRWVLPVSIS